MQQHIGEHTTRSRQLLVPPFETIRMTLSSIVVLLPRPIINTIISTAIPLANLHGIELSRAAMLDVLDKIRKCARPSNAGPNK
jgi:hypothetical protein